MTQKNNSAPKTARFKKRYIGLGILVFCIIFAGFLLSEKKEGYAIDSTIYKGPDRNIALDKTSATKKPNFIIILADDMGYGDMSAYGAQGINTPHLDKMAAQGVKFTNFYSSSGVCSPSRAGMLTGRYPIRTGVTFPIPSKNDSFFRKITRKAGRELAKLGATDLPVQESLVDGLPESEITIAEALGNAGYTSALIGKWHLGDFTVNPAHLPLNHGFDYFKGFNGANDSWPVAYWENNTEIQKDIGLRQANFTQEFTEEAIAFMERSKDQPFFLFLSHKDPHQPCIPSERFHKSSKAGPHGDTIQELDWSVGEILTYLKRNNLDENTLVLFTSDNGPWYDGSPGHLRGRKGQSYEGGYRVPMLAWWPGQIPTGNISDQPAMNIDFFPTLTHLAGVKSPTDRIIDGKNIYGMLTGLNQTPPHQNLYFFHNNDLEGIRQGKWKYIHDISQYVWPTPMDGLNTFVGRTAAKRQYTDKSFDPPRTVKSGAALPLLYDLSVDSGENYNLIEHYPDVGKKMLTTMKTWEKELFSNPRGWIIQ